MHMLLCSFFATWTLGREQISLPRVDAFASSPRPFTPFDWRRRATAYHEFIWSQSAIDYGLRWPVVGEARSAFGIASYANDTRFKPGDSEAIPAMGTVLGAAVVGVGRNRTRMEAATLKYALPRERIFHDFPASGGRGSTGGSFWYDLAPVSLCALHISD